MTAGVQRETEELEKILSLLKEYTNKLREICENRAASNYSYYQTTLLSSLLIIISFTIVFAFTQFDNPIISANPLLFFLIGVIIAFLSTYMISKSTRFRHSYDAVQVVATVERLIKTASQYSEHASQRISDKFEFDLRLAEAEAALRMYKHLFSDPKEK